MHNEGLLLTSDTINNCQKHKKATKTYYIILFYMPFNELLICNKTIVNNIHFVIILEVLKKEIFAASTFSTLLFKINEQDDQKEF